MSTDPAGSRPAAPTPDSGIAACTPADIVDSIDFADRRYLVRVAHPDDAEALLDLYRRLDTGDLHLRFFSTFRPSHHFVDHWLDRSRRGGEVLIVIEHRTHRPDRVIADAGYIPTGPDIAELAMTIDPHRRGWLGPYLLELVVERAHANGIAQLTADVLTTNAPMLALLRARGCTLLKSDDPAVVRLMIGTT